MAPANLEPMFPPTEGRSPGQSPRLAGLFKDSFSLPTLLVLGGLAQAALSLVLPARYALLPLVSLLLRAVVTTVRDVTSPGAYAAKRGVIQGRIAAHLPNTSYDPLRSEKSSLFGSAPAGKSVVVLHLGARLNHPLGVLAPGAQELGNHFMACNAEVLKRAKEYGCLGATSYRGGDTASNNTMLHIYFFRDLDGLNRFAHDPVHRQAWDWYNKEALKRGYTHLGIFHEAFVVPAGAYETIYVNMQPTLMADGELDVKNEATGTDEYVRTVVDASSPMWRSQHSRMGREVKRMEAEK